MPECRFCQLELKDGDTHGQLQGDAVFCTVNLLCVQPARSFQMDSLPALPDAARSETRQWSVQEIADFEARR